MIDVYESGLTGTTSLRLLLGYMNVDKLLTTSCKQATEAIGTFVSMPNLEPRICSLSRKVRLSSFKSSCQATVSTGDNQPYE